MVNTSELHLATLKVLDTLETKFTTTKSKDFPYTLKLIDTYCFWLGTSPLWQICLDNYKQFRVGLIDERIVPLREAYQSLLHDNMCNKKIEKKIEVSTVYIVYNKISPFKLIALIREEIGREDANSLAIQEAMEFILNYTTQYIY